MAIEVGALMQVITKTVIEATKAVMQAIMVDRGDETSWYRLEEAGARPMLGRH